MPILSRRNAPSLLRQVGNKQHATNEDHEEDSLPTPPASNNMKRDAAGIKTSTVKKDEDIFADPASSSDEDAATALPTAKTTASFRPSKKFNPTANGPAAGTSTFRKPAGISPDSTRSKRSASDEAENDADAGASSGSDDKMVFSSQTSFKKPRSSGLSGKARPNTNIHAPTGKPNMYGKKKVFTSKDRKDKLQPQKAGFKAAKGADILPPKPQAPAFKAAKGADMFTFGQREENGPGASNAQVLEDGTPGSPELSELSELDSEVEEVDVRTLGLPTPKDYVAKTSCQICGSGVPLMLKQGFQDEYTQGKAMDYKWQQRFCLYHKKESAKQTYDERKYPEIKWERLERRVRQHHDHLIAVLEGRVSSVYRKRLQKQLDSGAAKSAKSAFGDKAFNKNGVLDKDEVEIRPGYYGLKGERLMTEHILHHLSDELRERSANDPLIVASGVAGGVSGFVQAVLVPELAVALVREDLKVGEKRARDVLGESWELGELVHDEAEEKVEVTIDDDE